MNRSIECTHGNAGAALGARIAASRCARFGRALEAAERRRRVRAGRQAGCRCRAPTARFCSCRGANCRSDSTSSSEGTGTVGYLLNGKERVKLTEVAVAGTHLEIRMPGYENRLTADADGDQLEGEVVLEQARARKEQHIPFMRSWVRNTASFEHPRPTLPDVSGRWAVNFTDDEGKPEAAVGEFTQSQDIVTGTFLTDTGDHRFLAGQVQGDELYLSTFDGAHVFLYKAKFSRRRSSLAGDFWSGRRITNTGPPSAMRTPRCRMPTRSPHMRAGTKRFDFAFPDLAGNTVTSKDPAVSRQGADRGARRQLVSELSR